MSLNPGEKHGSSTWRRRDATRRCVLVWLFEKRSFFLSFTFSSVSLDSFSFFIPSKLTTIDRTDNSQQKQITTLTRGQRNIIETAPCCRRIISILRPFRLDARARMRIIHTSRWFALIGRATNRHSIREQPFYARDSSLYRYDYRYVRCKGYNCSRMRSIFRSTWITRCFVGQVSTSEPFISKTAQTS